MDREKAETGFELCANGEPCIGEKFMKCPFSPRNNAEQNCGVTMARNALALLKELIELLHKKQKDIDILCNEISEWKHKYHDRPLKEHEAVEPTWQQGKAYCGSCGKRIPLKIGARFCHKCGKPILLGGRSGMKKIPKIHVED